jgi:hypothetical protein
MSMQVQRRFALLLFLVFTGAMMGSFLHLYIEAAEHAQHQERPHQECKGLQLCEAEHEHHCGLCEFQFVIFTTPDWQMPFGEFQKIILTSFEFCVDGANSRNFTPQAPARAPPALV